MEDKSNFTPEKIKELLQDNSNHIISLEEIHQTEAALNRYAESYSVQPPRGLSDRILKKMSKLNSQSRHRHPFTLENLPMLTVDSNFLDWEDAVKEISPPQEFDDFYMHVLVSDATRDLMLGWSKHSIPEEVHYDLIESFIVLDGSCECHIWHEDAPDTKRKVHMHTGDFLQLELGESHDILTTSPIPVKAILQRIKVKAS
ncbi:MAG: hypothetical protein ABI844_13375 [Saprospiraceae bacterium]